MLNTLFQLALGVLKRGDTSPLEAENEYLKREAERLRQQVMDMESFIDPTNSITGLEAIVKSMCDTEDGMLNFNYNRNFKDGSSVSFFVTVPPPSRIVTGLPGYGESSP